MGSAHAQACTASNGSFRFLNDEFPQLSTNGPVFVGQLVVANADGIVAFSVDPGSPDPLPAGLSLDADSGLITGLPTDSTNKTVRFRADDGTQAITRDVLIKINSSGGGGNGGSGLTTPVFPNGEVGVAYSHTLTADGDGPFTFGGNDLPPGLSLNGATGEVSGIPAASGTFFMSLTVVDALPNEENIGASVVPIRIFPAGSTFAFVTQALNNGEVGTPFCDQYVVENPTLGGVVSFGASGLPSGLALDAATGAVTGTPVEPGTFLVTLSANDGTHTITTNLSMVIAPDSTSEFHWNYLGVPAALVNTLYDRNPPILLSAEGAVGGIDYAAVGLPAGITYNSGSGELTGTPTQVGEYPVTFTATDSGNSDVITLDLVFVVLPATGGDVSQISVNFWVARMKLAAGEPGGDSWAVSAYYNADRRTGMRFDPAADDFSAALGSRTVAVDAGEFVGDDQSMSYATDKAAVPSESVSLNADRQTAAWATRNDTLNVSVPGLLSQMVRIGDRAYRLVLLTDAKGGVKGTAPYQRTAFVLNRGSLGTGSAGSDSAKLGFLLADPGFFYEGGVSVLRMRILDGATVLMDRDFSALGGTAKLGTDKNTGRPTYAFKTLSDAEVLDHISMGYSSSKGAMKVSLSGLDLTAITPGEAHLTFEVTIGDRVYTTGVTFFGSVPGSYGLAIP